MTTDLKPLRFGHHALAVLGAAMLGATVFALIWTTALAVAAYGRMPGLAWVLTLAVACWLGVFIVALPGAGIALSLVFPITRRQTVAGNCICLLVGASMGIILAPLASPKLHGATPVQLGVFALTGAAVAGFYLILGRRLGRNVPTASASTMPIS